MNEKNRSTPTKTDPRILILSDGRMYGPFETQETAQAWVDAPHAVSPNYEMYSVWAAEIGTAEVAHECGTRLQGIDEATRTSRRATAG